MDALVAGTDAPKTEVSLARAIASGPPIGDSVWAALRDRWYMVKKEIKDHPDSMAVAVRIGRRSSTLSCLIRAALDQNREC